MRHQKGSGHAAGELEAQDVEQAIESVAGLTLHILAPLIPWSTQWTSDTSLQGRILCLPSPACRDMVGEKVRGGKVDLEM